VAGIIADLISANRKLLENVDLRLRRLELDARADGHHQLFTRTSCGG
jgi:hypothetical protein